MTLQGKIKKKDRLMSIDPSINNLGLAIWDLDDKKLIAHLLIHPHKTFSDNEYDKSYSMCFIIKEWKERYGVNKIICEVPDHWAVAGFEARETGSMVKLAFVCGMIYSLRFDLEEMKVVKPKEWKGQLPKKVVANRLQDQYIQYGIDMTKLNENVMDAIGIGHYYIYGSV
jgi:hypothetical protein